MRNICLLIKSYFKRNRSVVILSILGGLVLCLMIYFMGDYTASVFLAKVKVGVMDYDNSLLSENFKYYLTEELDYDLIENENYDYLSKLLIDKEISAIIEIPEGFFNKFSLGENQKITITSTDDYENAAFLEAYLTSYMASIRMLSVSSGGDKETFIHFINEHKNNYNPIYKDRAYNLNQKEFKDKEGFKNTIGFYFMIVFALAMVVSYIIVDDKGTGVYNRITVTPVKPFHYVAGNSLFGFFLLLLETLIYCGFIAVKNIKIGFPVYKLIYLNLLFSFFIICFVIDISLVLKSKKGISLLIMGFSTLGSILGGAFFPIDMAPENLQSLAKILPHFWIMDAFNKLMVNPSANIKSNIIILILFTVLAFLVGGVLYTQNYKRG